MKKRLARSFSRSPIEPETSIRQNITAWLVGTGCSVKALKRTSTGSMKPTHLRLALAFASCSLSAAIFSSAGGSSRSARSSAASSALTSSSFGRRSARRRPWAWRMVRIRLIWLGEPEVVMPARRQVLFGVSFSVVRTRLGSARSSKKMSRISSCVIVNSKSSSLSPLSAASLPRPAPSPERGFLISSPVENSLLPGSTKSRSPALFGSRRKRGSLVPFVDILILRSLARSATEESLSDFCTASRIWLRARRRKRWRLPSDLPLGFRRRSTKWVMRHQLSFPAERRDSGARGREPRWEERTRSFHLGPLPSRELRSRSPGMTSELPRLVHAHDELVVLGLRVAVLLGLERDHRQQILDLGEHAFLDDRADLLVRRPRRVLALVLRTVAQRELDDLVAEVLGVRDAGRLLDLGQLVVELRAVEELAGVGVLEILVLDPGVGIGDVAVEQVLAVFAVALQIRLLDLLADELGIARRQLRLDEFEIFPLGVVGVLLALDRLFQHVHQMHRIGRDLGGVVVERLRQRLIGEARRDAGHAFVNARLVLVFLQRLGLGVGVLQLLAVIDAHLRGQVGVLMLLEPGHHAELGQHLQRLGRARRGTQIGAADQLLVDLRLLADAQAIRHRHHADAVEEGLVVLVGLEHGPFGLVGMRQDRAVERDGAQRLGADVIAFLRRGQQGMQHLDRRLEHLDKFEQALIGAAQPARERIGVRIVLAVMLELADVDLTDERGDVLVVLVARLGLGDGELAQLGRIEPRDLEFGDVAAELVQALDRPGAHHVAEAVLVDAVFLAEQVGQLAGAEQAERALEHRRDVVAGFQHV